MHGVHALPPLHRTRRADSGCVQAFHASFKRCRYDLMRWRTISSLTEQQTAVLDANDGAGWELAAALLRPRKVQVRLPPPARALSCRFNPSRHTGAAWLRPPEGSVRPAPGPSSGCTSARPSAWSRPR